MTIWDRLERDLQDACPDLELRRDEPMARHTSFRIGGPAALMALPRTGEEAALAAGLARRAGVSPFFMGNGSNLLVADSGYDGFVIRCTKLDKMERIGDGIRAGSGALLSRLANFAAGEGLTGLEWAQGIPGSLGGAAFMNAGAYGGEMAQVIRTVTFLDETGEVVTLPAEKCAFGYRRSVFSGHPARLILGAELALAPGDREAIQARIAELSNQRRAKQPLDLPSAGSTFKRPAPVDGEAVYAAALIDQCGCKGLAVGGAMVSPKHAGFIVNTGGATCAHVLALAQQVRERVEAQTGVRLELEVKTLGGQ